MKIYGFIGMILAGLIFLMGLMLVVAPEETGDGAIGLFWMLVALFYGYMSWDIRGKQRLNISNPNLNLWKERNEDIHRQRRIK